MPSPPVVTPNTAVVTNQATHFTATATSTSALNYVWNFGDGSTATGSDVSHHFAAPGVYVVTVTATDAVGQSSTQTIPVTVTGVPFLVRKAIFTLSPTGDSAQITGIIHIPAGLTLAQQSFTAIVGGNTQTVPLSNGTRAAVGGNTLVLRTRTVRGVTTSHEAAFTLKMTGKLGAACKANSPLDSNGNPTQITVQIQLNVNYDAVTLQTTFKRGPKGATAVGKQ